MSKIIQALIAYTRVPIGATDVEIPLKYLKDSRGNYITAMPSGATKLYATIEPKSQNNQEIISFSGIRDDGNNAITLTGVIRNYNPQDPNTNLPANVPHGNNVEIVLSNNPPFYNTFMQSDSDNNITGLFTFDNAERPQLDEDTDSSDDKDLATVGQLKRTAFAGVGDASETSKGIVEIATETEINNNTETGSQAALSINPKNLATSKYGQHKSTPSATNKILTENEVYTDGVSVNQSVSDSDMIFGQADATTKKTKVYQSFTATKSTIKSFTIKKGKTYYVNPTNTANNLAFYSFDNVLTDSLGKAGNMSAFYGTPTFVNDSEGVANNARRYTSGAKDTATLATAITGAWFMEWKGKRSGGSTGTNSALAEVGDYTSNNGCGFWLDNTDNQVNIRVNQQYGGNNSNLKTGYILPLDTFVKLKATYDGANIKFYVNDVLYKTIVWTTNPTSATLLTVGARKDTNSEYQTNVCEYFAIGNVATATAYDPLSNVVVKVMADNNNAPNTASILDTKTIVASQWEAITEGVEYSILLSSILTNTQNVRYWLELSQATPSNNTYPSIKKSNTDTLVGESLKSWNTTDTFVAETGALYLKIFESYEGKLALFSDTLPNYFGDGSDGDVTISTNTTLSRDMFYNNLTINSGVTLTTGNYKIYVKNKIDGTGTISANGLGALGGNGNGGGGKGGDGGGLVFISARYISGVLITANGTNGVNGSGGNGGYGYSGNGAGGTTTSTSLSTLKTYIVCSNSILTKDFISLASSAPSNFSGAGGGGGGGTNGSNPAPSAGGNGGYGLGNGGAAAKVSNAFQGDGGGGGGGTVMVFTTSFSSVSPTANGGTGGNPGIAGNVLLLIIK